MSGGWRAIDRKLLRAWPLPAIAQDADKEDRGRVLVVAGSRELAGAAVLASVAALRAGAGKLVIATGASVAARVASAVPEARVIALPENDAGGFDPAAVERLESSARGAAAALVGPGLMDTQGTVRFTDAMLALLTGTPVVLDAAAMDVVRSRKRFAQPMLLTPHAGEMAHLLGQTKDAVCADPQATADRAARMWNAVVALKGASTAIAAPDGGRWLHRAGHPGLATSGSGDVLSGLIAGLAAGGAPLPQACAWGVALHAMAGARLARRLGEIGFLARELAGEVPALMRGVHPRSGSLQRPK
jgi:hydroxyethylthiazole kinase-like uncharacterized protein yjeF